MVITTIKKKEWKKKRRKRGLKKWTMNIKKFKLKK